MELGLAGRVAIVTGASKGIGLAVTEALVDEGVAVVAGARRPSPELTRLVRTGRVDFVAADLATADGPAHLIDAAAGRFCSSRVWRTTRCPTSSRARP